MRRIFIIKEASILANQRTMGSWMSSKFSKMKLIKYIFIAIILFTLAGCNYHKNNLSILNKHFRNKELSDIYLLTNYTYDKWLNFNNQDLALKEKAIEYFNNIAEYLNNESFEKSEELSEQLEESVVIRINNVNSKELILKTYVSFKENGYFSVYFNDKLEFYKLTSTQNKKIYELTVNNPNYPFNSDNIKLIDFNK